MEGSGGHGVEMFELNQNKDFFKLHWMPNCNMLPTITSFEAEADRLYTEQIKTYPESIANCI